MRFTDLKETVNHDVFNPAFNDTQFFDGLTYRASSEEDHQGKPYFVIKVFDDNFERVGLVKFALYSDKSGNEWLESLISAIQPEYQGKGIASNIYAYARMLGNTIKPSSDQTQQGRDMWTGWTKSGAAKHLTSNESKFTDYELAIMEGGHSLEKSKSALREAVEENFADGRVKGKSRPGRVKRSGASCDGSISDLRAKAKNASGERAKMYHWCANMKSGRINESEILDDLEESWKNWIANTHGLQKTSILERKVSEITVSGYKIDVDSHALDQLVRRNVSPISVDKILRSLNTLSNDISSIENGYKFWVWNPELEVGLGMRKLSGTNNLLLATLVGSKPYDGPVPILQIGSVNEDQLNELVYKGYPCTKDCSGHAAGYKWSDDRDITDPNLCPYSNNSFWEGCLAHTDEQE